MMRKILMAAPILAFALPLAFTASSSARPLSNPTPEAEFCWGGCGDDDDDGGALQLQWCVEVQIPVNRDYECALQQGPSCLANCTAEAVTPLCLNEVGARSADLAACQEERAAVCRSQCDSGGAAFCSPSERWGNDDDDDDDDDNGGGVVFIDVDVCIWLEF